MNLMWFIDSEKEDKMATTTFNKKKYTQQMVMMDRNIHDRYKRKCKEIGINPKNLFDSYSDKFLEELIEKIDNRDIDLLNIVQRRRVEI